MVKFLLITFLIFPSFISAEPMTHMSFHGSKPKNSSFKFEPCTSLEGFDCEGGHVCYSARDVCLKNEGIRRADIMLCKEAGRLEGHCIQQIALKKKSLQMCLELKNPYNQIPCMGAIMKKGKLVNCYDYPFTSGGQLAECLKNYPETFKPLKVVEVDLIKAIEMCNSYKEMSLMRACMVRVRNKYIAITAGDPRSEFAEQIAERRRKNGLKDEREWRRTPNCAYTSPQFLNFCLVEYPNSFPYFCDQRQREKQNPYYYYCSGELYKFKNLPIKLKSKVIRKLGYDKPGRSHLLNKFE